MLSHSTEIPVYVVGLRLSMTGTQDVLFIWLAKQYGLST